MSFDGQAGRQLPDQQGQVRFSDASPAGAPPAAPFPSDSSPVLSPQSFAAQAGQRAGLLRAFQTSDALAAGAATGQTPAESRAAPVVDQAPKSRRLGLGRGGGFGGRLAGRRAASSAIKPPLSPGGRTRFIVRLVLLLVFLGAVWFFFVKASGGPSTLSPGATASSNGQPTIVSGATAPSNGQPTPGTTNTPVPTASATLAPTATPGKTRPSSAEQVTAACLSAYFTWNGGESDQSYIMGWSEYVVPRAVATLDTTAPRQWLDNGDDSDAQSPVPAIPAGSAQIQGHTAQVQVAWTIQVVPPSSEQITWQARQIQAMVWLIQSGNTWLITDLTWQSSGT